MNLKGHIENIRKKIETELSGKSKSGADDYGYIELAISEVPKIIEKKEQGLVFWGEDNLYPQAIEKLKYGSAIHNAILETSAEMIAGDGYLINGAKTKEESELMYSSLVPDEKNEYDRYLRNEHDDLTNEEINSKLSFDLKEMGACCCEVFYNNEGNKIVRKKYIDVRNIRPGTIENEKVVSYKYSADWAKANHADYRPVPIEAYDPDKEGKTTSQLIFKKRGTLKYVGQPDWVGCVTWVQIDCQMAIFHLSNIENGMNPSLKIQFFKKPGSETERQDILDDIRKTFVGAKKTGRHMVFFSDGKEFAPTVEPVQVSGLDKQQIVLAELCDKKILTGHKLTSPLLAGISVSGQIGGNTELEKAFHIYNKTRIFPMSKIISGIDQQIFDFNKLNIKLQINPYNPFI